MNVMPEQTRCTLGFTQTERYFALEDGFGTQKHGHGVQVPES